MFSFSQKLPGRHDRFRSDKPGIGKMGQMPVIRVLAPLLGKIGTGPFRTYQMGPVLHIIAGEGDPLRTEVPIDIPDKLGMAEGTSVSDIKVPAQVFESGSGPKDIRRLFADGGPGQNNGHQKDGSKDDQAPENNDGADSFSSALPPAGQGRFFEPIDPVYTLININQAQDRPTEDQQADGGAQDHVNMDFRAESYRPPDHSASRSPGSVRLRSGPGRIRPFR